MKENYEFLNDIDIDESEMVEKDLSEFRKKKIKHNVMKSIKKRKYKRNGLIAAAISCAIISGLGVVGTLNPAYASDIPIVGDIFKYINGRNERYDKYKENSNEINITKESNGIEITIKDAVFDGRTIYYTYELKSNRDLGETPIVGVGTDHIQIEGEENTRFSTGAAACKKVSDNTYVGQDDYTMDDEREEIKCKLKFSTIRIVEEGNNEEIQGEWNFNITLKATKNTNQVINKGFEKNGIKVNIENLTKTPMSFVLEYSLDVGGDLREKDEYLYSYAMAKDENDKIYASPEGASGSTKNGVMHCRQEFSALDENATKLIITPKLRLISYHGEKYLDANNEMLEIKPSTNDHFPGNAEITLDEPIVIELQK